MHTKKGQRNITPQQPNHYNEASHAERQAQSNPDALISGASLHVLQTMNAPSLPTTTRTNPHLRICYIKASQQGQEGTCLQHGHQPGAHAHIHARQLFMHMHMQPASHHYEISRKACRLSNTMHPGKAWKTECCQHWQLLQPKTADTPSHAQQTRLTPKPSSSAASTCTAGPDLLHTTSKHDGVSYNAQLALRRYAPKHNAHRTAA
jgi:hypothetical protein